MPVFAAIATIGVGIFSLILGFQEDETNQELANQTLKFGEKELAQENEHFLASLGITKEDLAIKKEALEFKKEEAAQERLDRQKERTLEKRKSGANTLLGLFGAQSGLSQRVLEMWGNTGYFGGGAGKPPTLSEPVGGGVFSAS
jgi:hypothetical protein